MKASSPIPLPVLVYDCDRCGACCRNLILECDHVDVLREPLIAEKATLLDGRGNLELEQSRWGLNARKGDSFACVFLGADNRCGIYQTRPTMCTHMQAGSRQCQMAREIDDLPPLEPRHGTGTIIERIHILARTDPDEEMSE